MKKKLILITLLPFILVVLMLSINLIQGRQIIKQFAQTPSTIIYLKISLAGIGNAGDSLNPTDTSLSTKYPANNSRKAKISFFRPNGDFVLSQAGDVLTYEDKSGTFVGTGDLGNNLPTGDYIIKIKVDGYLETVISQVVHIPIYSEVYISNVIAVAGDLTGDNKLDINDYNMLMGCYSDFLAANFCDADKQKLADYSNDGNVNVLDYNLFIREYSQHATK